MWQTGSRATADGRRHTGNGKRADGRRATADGQTADGQRQTGNGIRATANGRLQTGDGKRATADGRRHTGRRQTGNGRRNSLYLHYILINKMIQQIIIALIFLSALGYLLFRFYPGLFGKKKSENGCGSCGDKVDIVKEIRKVSQDL